MYHLCHFDTKKLTEPKLMLNYMNFNCTSDQYTAAKSGICSQCDASCQTCKGGSSTDCTSCDLGKYLTSEGTCLTCDPQGMVLGSSGECVEKCGDGLNFGLLQCDDGNLIAGDGCSPTCQVESDWTCSGGTTE